MSTYSSFYQELSKLASDNDGWLAAQMAASRAMAEGGVGGFTANPELMTDRGIESLKGAGVLGLLGLLLGSLTGASVGALLGGDLESAISGAAAGGGLGGAAGIVGGTALGTAKADKDFLKSRGMDTSIPIPLKTILAPFPLAAIAPIGSHAKVSIGSKAFMDKRAEADSVPGLSKRKRANLDRTEARQRVGANVLGGLAGLAVASGKKAKKLNFGNRYNKLLSTAIGAKGADQVVETAHEVRRANLTKEYYDRKQASRRRRAQANK
jgi:hypothetical protein